ncbi:serine/threonine-protein phosphatase 7 long form homolog [Arachis ipaensis]|uniref:serine/threonine-protein phosphatase 7 long form homolog n=1 Tax=Arachis ipaensis TaxID=130454 RepID=UPI000A2B8166|nr:serine/threonine-protein phosphatase 7 long form homolog [Arachis ipaensis]
MIRSAGRWPRGTLVRLLYFNLTYLSPCTLLMYYKSVTHLISHNTHVSCRWSGYNPSGSEKGPRVQMWRLRIDMLQDRDFIWMPYSLLEVLQVVHPEVLEPRHTVLWRSVTSLIYFAVIEWHQIDRVLPQFGGVHPRPHPALNIDFLMSKDGRSGDRSFPYALQSWHFHRGRLEITSLVYQPMTRPFRRVRHGLVRGRCFQTSLHQMGLMRTLAGHIF